MRTAAALISLGLFGCAVPGGSASQGADGIGGKADHFHDDDGTPLFPDEDATPGSLDLPAGRYLLRVRSQGGYGEIGAYEVSAR